MPSSNGVAVAHGEASCQVPLSLAHSGPVRWSGAIAYADWLCLDGDPILFTANVQFSRLVMTRPCDWRDRRCCAVYCDNSDIALLVVLVAIVMMAIEAFNWYGCFAFEL